MTISPALACMRIGNTERRHNRLLVRPIETTGARAVGGHQGVRRGLVRMLVALHTAR